MAAHAARVLLASLLPAVAGGQTCQPKDLFIRSLGDVNGNAMPVDIFPVPGNPMKFSAVMDYGMKGFQLEASASPPESCVAKLSGAPIAMVDAGSSFISQVALTNHETGATSICQVNVSRLSGKEIILSAVRIKGAYLVPAWNSAVKSYVAYLDLSRDLIEVSYVALDNGQVVGLSAQPEFLGDPLAGAAAGPPPPVRRLQPSTASASSAEATAFGDGRSAIGEVQRVPATLVSTIDTGRVRVLDLLVRSADKSAKGSYRLEVRRPFCPADRRFFDGASRVCTDVCNEGHFGNHATGRCTPCLQDHCLVCEGGTPCTLCDDNFELRSGICFPVGTASSIEVIEGAEATARSYAQEHKALLFSAFSVAVLALTACMVLVCFKDRCGGMPARNPRLLDSEDEEELVSFRDYDERRHYYEQ